MTIAAGQKMCAVDILNLTFFPKGTILTFNSDAYNATSTEFKSIWKICNGENGTPNLVNKFLRGGTTSGALGGTDSVTLNANHIPAHSHSFSATTSSAGAHTHTYSNPSIGVDEISSGRGPTGTKVWPSNTPTSSDGSHSHSFSGVTSSYGSGSASVPTVPSYYQVIYIMKVIS